MSVKSIALKQKKKGNYSGSNTFSTIGPVRDPTEPGEDCCGPMGLVWSLVALFDVSATVREGRDSG